MLNLNPRIVCVLIERAREFHNKSGFVASDDVNPTPEEVTPELIGEHRSDPTFLEFKAVVDDLEPDQQVALVALMWLGRGDFDADEWDTAFEQADDSRTPHAAEYLLATPLVADYLEEGLAALGYSCDE